MPNPLYWNDPVYHYSETGVNPDIARYNEIATPKEYLKGKDGKILGFDYRHTVTESDIDKGYIHRYFARQANQQEDGEIVEISETQYNQIQNIPLYVVAKVRWRISGKLESRKIGDRVIYTGVEDANSMARDDAERQLRGVAYKMTNLLLYYQGI